MTRIGGLVGRCNVDDLTFDKCAVNAIIGTMGDSKDHTNVGMISGLMNKVVKSGTIYVFGQRKWLGTNTKLTAENYTSFLYGSNESTNFANVTVVFEDKKQ